MNKRSAEVIPGKRSFKFGIAPKLLIGILLPLFLVLTVMSIFLGSQTSGTISQIMCTELDAESEAASSQINAFFERYYGISECLATTQLIRDTTTEEVEAGITTHRLYGSLLETLRLLQQKNSEDVDYMWVLRMDTGEVVQNNGAVYSPPDFDYTTRSWYKLVVEQQDTIITEVYSSINDNQMMLTIASPVYHNGKMVAIVGLDLNMDHLYKILDGVAIGKEGYVTLIDPNNLIVYHPDSSLINTNVSEIRYSQNMSEALTNKTDSKAMLYTRNGIPYYGTTCVLNSLGYMVLSAMPEAEYTAHTNNILKIVFVGIVVCGVILAAVCIFMALSITRPLKRLNVAVGMLAEGKLDVEVQSSGRDEVSEVSNNVGRIVNRLKDYILYIDEIAQVLHQIAAGNLIFTLQHTYAGEFAKVKDALLDIRSTLTDAMTSIAQSATQVNAGAEQIASGAQALAQGATEQASSVQELSSTVQQLSGQATDEAAKAVEAGRFLQQIKSEVEKCTEQMALMRNAMSDISTQSTAIKTIIKTIDDIAFQTNILALNAAVEAARAGNAGKGFSVVADEVRNLAAKSAEAAQKTNELIENSVRAVQHGEELTQATSASLSIVAEGTKQVVGTIETVAATYHDQADKLSEIAMGVDQISSVVQTNSATAEESAAASQELSSQADMMRQQVAQFQLEGQEFDFSARNDQPYEAPFVTEDAMPTAPMNTPFDADGKY